MNFRQTNIITGWIVFAISAMTYLLTMEPTASFWDCGEFIATAYKLEVGHPPGAPLFMILARVASLFAFGNTANVAMMINAISALSSALTVMFLFWTITHLAKKIVVANDKLTTGNLISVIGSGVVGALAYNFSDTFWFSAVEGEVYALSSLFTAVVFWAILKWENEGNDKYANRWLILIAYLMGLSIGVHLLNLLAIPAIVFVYYFKKYKTTRNGIVLAGLISVVLLGSIMYVIIPGIVTMASKFELIFTNGFGLPFNTGTFLYALLLVGLIVWGLKYTIEKKKAVLNTLILGITVIIIGYSSFTMIVIRSFANPPIDENNPENVFALLSYLNREQYGDRPLFYGQYFNSPVIGQENKQTYIQKDGKYEEITLTNPVYEYDKRFMTFFPRMYSPQSNHKTGYKNWVNIEGKPITVQGRGGQAETIHKPTFGENLAFFLRYQLGHMYFRYFMWNFAGRQNDVQGHGEITHGNWISGIPFIDNTRLGPQDNLPNAYANNNARNKYFLLPLLLGIIGLFFSAKFDNKGFWVVMLLFFFTGIAIVMYLNQTPYQPRERDYAYAGSFYAFSIWIGLGVMSIFYFIKKYLNSKNSAIVATVVCLLVPGIMAAENWDDHDRSGRYTARDFAKNYLYSCQQNAIIFTYGDNDTFPLWYAQEVEGIRTDVRVVNLSLLSTDWYINQMRRKAYLSDPVAISFSPDMYVQGKRDIVPVLDKVKDYYNLKDLMQFVASDSPKTKITTGANDEMDFLPTKNFRVAVDSAKVVENGTVTIENASRIVDALTWRISKNYLTKSDLMVLDIISENNWERPIYFAGSIGSDNFIGLHDYLRLEGFAYRLVPYRTKNVDGSVGDVDTDLLYDNVMNKFTWGRMEAPDVNIDEQNRRTAKIMNIRDVFARLAQSCIKEGKKDSAKQVLLRCLELMPNHKFPFDYYALQLAEPLYKCGANEEGDAFVSQLAENVFSELDYQFGMPDRLAASIQQQQRIAMHVISRLIKTAELYNRTEMKANIDEKLEFIIQQYGGKMEQ